MVSWSVNSLLSKRESLNWIHRTHVKERDMVAYACNLRTGVAGEGLETGRCLGLTGQSALGACQVSERPYLKDKLNQNKVDGC